MFFIVRILLFALGTKAGKPKSQATSKAASAENPS